MAELNKTWIITTFAAVLAATARNEYAVLDSAWEEVKEMKKLTYITPKPKLHKDGTLIAYVASKDAHIEDLINDLGLNLEDYIDQIPAELRKMPNAENLPETDAAPVVPAVPVAATAEPVAAAIPTEHAEVVIPELSEQAAPKAPIVGGDVSYAVVDKVTRGDSEIAIEVGIAYELPQVAAKRSSPKATAESQPYNEIATYKVAHPETAPSFHLAGRKTKDVSGLIKRHAERYEKSHGVTFRAAAARADDPLGEGVRVFALFNNEAPARRAKKVKKEVEAPTENVSE